MSQDNGAKEDGSQIAQEEALAKMKQPIENDRKGPEDNPPPQSDNKWVGDQPPSPSDHKWNGCVITALVIAGIVIV